MSFRTTRWSVVVAAGGGSSPDARRALETLCTAYWYPLYAFARRRGRSTEAAQDAVQGFFAHFLAGDAVAAADPARGRFRSFLLACFANHLRNDAARAGARKRGGGAPVLSLDGAGAERRFAREPAHDGTPERLYERDWALTLLDRVLADLRTSYAGRGKEALFDALKDTLPGGAGGAHAERAETLGMTPGAFKVAAHRLRTRFRDALTAEIAETLVDGEAVDDEIAALFRALSPV